MFLRGRTDFFAGGAHGSRCFVAVAVIRPLAAARRFGPPPATARAGCKVKTLPRRSAGRRLRAKHDDDGGDGGNDAGRATLTAAVLARLPLPMEPPVRAGLEVVVAVCGAPHGGLRARRRRRQRPDQQIKLPTVRARRQAGTEARTSASLSSSAFVGTGMVGLRGCVWATLLLRFPAVVPVLGLPVLPEPPPLTVPGPPPRLLSAGLSLPAAVVVLVLVVLVGPPLKVLPATPRLLAGGSPG